MTAHNEAKKNDFAKTVLMPGDPLRAKFIAETYLENPKLVNNVRGVQGYTGTYHSIPVSVMASGMGMPSIGIYSYELFHFYNVDNIIRVGSAGSLQKRIKLRDIIIALGACTDSRFAEQYRLPGTFCPTADFALLENAVVSTKANDCRFHVGNVLSSDHFYNDDPDAAALWAKMGVLATEMESAALYMTAARCGKRALSILTVSDSIVTGEETSAAERQSTFNEMAEIALDTAARMEALS